MPAGIPSLSDWGMRRFFARACEVLLFVFVDLLGIEHAVADDLQPLGRNLPEKAARVTLVASSAADLLDLEQDGVRVEIEIDAFDVLDVPALFALAPQLVAAAAEVDCPA